MFLKNLKIPLFIFLITLMLLYYRFKPEFKNSIKCELKWEPLNLMYHCLKDQQDYFNVQVKTITQLLQREKIKEQLDIFQIEFNERTE